MAKIFLEDDGEIVFDGEILNYLLELMNQKNAMISAINCYDLEKLKQEIKNNPDGVNTPGVWGAVPLHFAVYKNGDFTQTLIDNSAIVNVADQKGNTPLHGAVDCDNPETVKLLMRFNADPSIKNNYDKSPLDLAREKSNQALIDALQNYTNEVTDIAPNGEVPNTHSNDDMI